MNHSHATPTAPATPEPIYAVDENQNGLRLTFHWLGDRFGHTVEKLAKGLAAGTLLRSKESDSSQNWPDSPPIQQLSIEPITGLPTALGVGLAGAGHWSISANASTYKSRPAIVFDVAIRFTKTPDFCGSRYDTLDAAAQVIPVDSITPTSVRSELGVVTISPNASELQTLPTPLTSKSTLRWAYVIVG